MAVTILEGHCVERLRELPAQHFHCLVTSPPYAGGIRRYGTAPQVWGGDPSCLHVWSEPVTERKRGQDAGASARVGNTKKRVSPPVAVYGQECASCGAWRGELGSEALPDCLAWARKEPPCPRCYVCHMRTIFGGKERPEGVWRVLRDDGTAWLNEGDAYVTHAKGHGGHGSSGQAAGAVARQEARSPSGSDYGGGRRLGLAEHNLLMAPARVGLALQADGWTLRQQNVWLKTSPMPESVSGPRWERCQVVTAISTSADRGYNATAYGDAPQGAKVDGQWVSRSPRVDCPGCERCTPNDGLVLRWGAWRPTSAVEFVYLLTKTDRYFADQEAVRQPMAESSSLRLAQDTARQEGSWRANGGSKINGAMKAVGDADSGRNLWNWWPIAAGGGGDKEAGDHYATYPEALAALCLQAGTSAGGCCAVCGAPFVRVVERESMVVRRTEWAENAGTRTAASGTMVQAPSSRTLGWKASCGHGGLAVPCRALETFAGSGTTLVVGDRLGLDMTGIELKPEYAQMSERRVRNDAPLFADVRLHVLAPAQERDSTNAT